MVSIWMVPLRDHELEFLSVLLLAQSALHDIHLEQVSVSQPDLPWMEHRAVYKIAAQMQDVLQQQACHGMHTAWRFSLVLGYLSCLAT